MFGNTLTLTIGGAAKALSLINQDQYASEYYLKSATGEHRVKIKHSKDRVSNGMPERHRHVITLTEKVYPTPTTLELNRTSQVTIVGDFLDGAGVQADNLVGLEAFVNKANAEKLINWES